MSEQWRPVTGVHEALDGIYEVSSLGRVRRVGGKPLAPGVDAGYPFVHMVNGPVKRVRRIHRLVALAFLENPKSLPVVRHRNHVKTDNRPENLAWGTTAQNNRDNVRDGRANGGRMPGERHPNAKLTDAQAAAILADPRGLRTVAKDYGVSAQTIWRIRRGHGWGHVKRP